MSTIWYARNVGDYGRKTGHLSLMEHGAYTLLLDWYYANDRPLPANAMQLHRICMAIASDEQAAVQSVLDQFFELRDGQWHNHRADEELAKRRDISEKRSDAAGKRWSGTGANADAKAPTSTSTSTSTKNTSTSGARRARKASNLSNSAGPADASDPHGYRWERGLSFGENQTRAWLVEWAKTRTRPKALLYVDPRHLDALVKLGAITELERAWIISQQKPQEEAS